MSRKGEGRIPPHNLDAEESLLGSLLLRGTSMKEVLATTHPSDFYKPAHQIVFDAMQGLHFTGQHIDAVTVADELRRAGLLEEIGGVELLLELQHATPAISNFMRYANIVVETSRLRTIIGRCADIVERCYGEDQADDVIAELRGVNGEERIISRDSEISDLYTADELRVVVQTAEEEGDKDWLIPGCLKARWRIILVAGEGVGKAVLMRFLGFHVAAGRDPWAPETYIQPRRVLYVDTENEESTIVHQMEIANTRHDMDLFTEADESGNWHTWHKPGGINLRDRRTLAEFERVLERTRPEIVLAGPLYKLYRRNRHEDMEQAALEFTEALDDLRVRFGFALILEHHAPKASSGAYRELNPFGSSLFMRWPVMGVTLEIEGGSHRSIDYEVSVGRFRRDRVSNDWPDKIYRSSSSKYAFTGYWLQGRGGRLEQARLQGL